MRTLELTLWIVAALWGGSLVIRRPSRAVKIACATAAVAVGAAHFFIEGYRFQMVPTYLLLAAVGTASWAGLLPGVGYVTPGLAICLFIAGGLPTVFPVFEYERPDGPYAIGTSVYELDHAPAWPQHPDERRDLAIQIWYPADASATSSGAPRVPITSRADALQGTYASLTGLPSPLFDHLRLLKTHATMDVPVSAGQPAFPVVLFSPGFGAANRSQSLFQLQALAARGFIVVAIDHTWLTAPTVFPDGRVVPVASDVTWPTPVNAKIIEEADTFLADVRFVLDRLEGLNYADPNRLLTGRLDLTRIGYLGASFGGSVVVHALLDEPRIKAGVAQDGKPYFRDEALTRLRRPLMYLQSASPYIASTDAQLAKWGLTQKAFREAEQDHYARQMRLFAAAQGPYYNVFIRRTDHVTFSDLYLVINLPSLTRMNIRQAHRIINDYTTAFFERYLNGVPTPLVDGSTPSPYPDVTVASRNVPQQRR